MALVRYLEREITKNHWTMKITNIRGKDYVEVSERIKHFNATYPNGSITSTIVYDGNYVRCIATVVPDVSAPLRTFIGHAEEDRSQGNINKTNATENCETSAVGRALGMMGIGIIDSVASADEVRHAVHKQEVDASLPEWSQEDGNWEDVEIPVGKNKGTKLGKLTSRQLEWYAEEYSPSQPSGKRCKAAAKYGLKERNGDGADQPFVDDRPPIELDV